MNVFFSAAKGGFYIDTVHDCIPDDAVEISAERHAELLRDQAAGGRISADADGRPVIGNHPEPSQEDRALNARRVRTQLLTASDYRAMPDYPQGESERASWLAYRQQLRDLPATKGFPSSIGWPTPPG